MNTVSLQEYVIGLTQEQAARKVGVTQSGLSKMLLSQRKIFVRTDPTGEIMEVYEIKPIGASRAA